MEATALKDGVSAACPGFEADKPVIIAAKVISLKWLAALAHSYC
jgi:hypothetical protein